MPEGSSTGFFLCCSIVPTWQKASAPQPEETTTPLCFLHLEPAHPRHDPADLLADPAR